MSNLKVFGKLTAEAIVREEQRLAALEQLDMLDTPRDPAIDRIVRLIQSIFAVDIGLVSFIDSHRQWYKSCSGIAGDEVPLQDTFCRFVVDSGQPMIIQDASKVPHLAGLPAVAGDAHIRFYAGVPLMTADGHVVGTVCAIDRRPRSFGARDLLVLQELAGAVMDRVDLLKNVSTDSLTGALTRHALKEEADRMIGLAVRHEQDLSCLVLDVDHFKKVNDTYGHAAGDEVLKQVTSACRSSLRAGDLLGRQGGEEFVILLPQVHAKGALAAAEKIRSVIECLDVQTAAGHTRVTVSIGVSSLSIVGRDMETLLAQADAAMYRAKESGRNRCDVWGGLRDHGNSGSRRRVLKAASIIFNEGRSTLSCTVRTIGSSGAGISLSATTGIPPEFTLTIPADGFQSRCRIIAQTHQNLEVSFI